MKPKSFTVRLDHHAKASLNDFPPLPKFGVYVILSGADILRIGESGSGAARLSKGFREPLRRTLRGKDRKNYIAYAWRSSYPNRRLEVDYFKLEDERFKDNHFRRALEAEITFQFRIANRRWPSEMSEVHFLERFRTDSLLVQTVTAILTHYGLRFQTV